LQTHFKDDADKAYPVYDEVKDELDEEDLNGDFTDEDDVCSDIVGKRINDKKMLDYCHCQS
jgi:hypothetical protein